MVNIRPFRGIRPLPMYASKVASKPYDVLSTAEAREEAKGNPYSFLNVIKAEITLPEGIDPYGENVYIRARENLQKLIREGILIQDDAPRLYIYRQKMGDWEQTGLVAASSIDDYFNGIIKKHEYTRPKKEKDRIDNIYALGVHPGPVFLTYRDVEEINRIIGELSKEEALYHFKSDDDVVHSFWAISDKNIIEKLTALFKGKVTATYIADGHHRAAASAKVGRIMREQAGSYSGDEAFNYFLTVLFPASHLNIIDYNRVVSDLKGMEAKEFLGRLEEKFEVSSSDGPVRPEAPHIFGLYLDGKWYRLQAKAGSFDSEDSVDRLDVSILQKNILDEILDIKDPRTDERVGFVGGIRGLKELERLVDNGSWKAAFSLYPVNMEELMRISDEGKVMPPKSTWFEPKLRSGLILHEFREEGSVHALQQNSHGSLKEK